MGVGAALAPAGDGDLLPADGYGLGDLDFHLRLLLSNLLQKRKKGRFSRWEKRRFGVSFLHGHGHSWRLMIILQCAGIFPSVQVVQDVIRCLSDFGVVC